MGKRRRRALALWLAALVPSAAAASPKVVVLGFDGADARLVERWMDEGKLPNLSRLREQGSYAPLEPTNPPQTPVSWSSFATGVDPGRTEIFDWLKRDPDNYLPDFAMVSESKRRFLWGAANGWGLGLIAAALGALGGVALALPWRAR
ncbi:MAG TPA: alkaline phosphatase family protein, partial [Candidatus Polarisedimenticolaceae bacterium]|nr:alkaline phosphatase family protein [Candidatus Polarisedimenticolaceae bacterium]